MAKKGDWVRLEVPDYGVVAVPVETIARHRATRFADEFGGDIERSLAEDTWPLFADDDFNVLDWARNNMNWEDAVEAHITVEREVLPGPDFQEAWLDEEMEVVEGKDVGRP
jgi:hypothetical protein